MHPYSANCYCVDCVAYEKRLRDQIREEDNGFELKSGPTNLSKEELDQLNKHRPIDKSLKTS